MKGLNILDQSTKLLLENPIMFFLPGSMMCWVSLAECQFPRTQSLFLTHPHLQPNTRILPKTS